MTLLDRSSQLQSLKRFRLAEDSHPVLHQIVGKRASENQKGNKAMKILKPRAAAHLAVVLILATGTLVVSPSWPLTVAAQDRTPDPGTHKKAGQPTGADQDLAAQLRELKAKAAVLEAALMKRYPAAGSKDVAGGKGMGAMGSGGMGMMGGKGMGMMGGSDDDEMTDMMKTMRTMMEMKMMQMKNKNMMGGMSGMQADTGAMPGKGMGMKDMDMMMGGMGGGTKGMSGGMGMMDMDMQEMMGMMGGMGQKGTGMGKMQMATALPGFPGASHIYHIGATGFFLDHPEHITLTTEQQTELNGLKEQALLEKSTSQRKIDEAEQELWTLTASDQPDVKKIDVKVREIEKLRGDQRIAFIRAVGEAANVLTPEQRQILVGTLPPTPAANTNHKHTP